MGSTPRALTERPAAYFIGSPNRYVVVDAGDYQSDASFVMREAGAMRWEAGMVGDIDTDHRHPELPPSPVIIVR